MTRTISERERADYKERLADKMRERSAIPQKYRYSDARTVLERWIAGQ